MGDLTPPRLQLTHFARLRPRRSRAWPTVLGGAVIEALLHWKLSSATPVVPNLNRLHLPEFIHEAQIRNLIKADTVKAVELAKDFQNLIHPGRVARLGVVCDRGTAHMAIGAVNCVIRDL